MHDFEKKVILKKSLSYFEFISQFYFCNLKIKFPFCNLEMTYLNNEQQHQNLDVVDRQQ